MSVPEDTVIYFTISKGPKMVDVPDVTGLDVDTAISKLKSLGLEYSIVELPGGDVAGIVIDQNYLNSNVAVGTTVTQRVSSGPQESGGDTPTPDPGGEGGGDNGGSGETEPSTGGEG